jgi:hypothetical protein
MDNVEKGKKLLREGKIGWRKLFPNLTPVAVCHSFITSILFVEVLRSFLFRTTMNWK